MEHYQLWRYCDDFIRHLAFTPSWFNQGFSRWQQPGLRLFGETPCLGPNRSGRKNTGQGETKKRRAMAKASRRRNRR